MATAEAQAAPVYNPPQPYLGQVLLWYAHADVKNEPIPGLCNSVDGNGIVSIALLKKNHATVEAKVGVRHVTDPHHKKMTEATQVRGGWDFTEGYKLEQGLPIEPTADEALVLKHFDQLTSDGTEFTASDIAAKVTDETKKSWSHQRVNAVLRKFKRE